MTYKWIDGLYIFYIYFLSLDLRVHARLPCRHIHEEISTPLLLSITSDQGHNIVLISVEWRSEILRLRLTPHDIAPQGTVAEWLDGDNFTEVETLRDGIRYYQGHVIGKGHTYIALTCVEHEIMIYTNQSGIIQNGHEGIFVEPYSREMHSESTYGRHRLTSCGMVMPPPAIDIDQQLHRVRRAPSDSFTKYLEVLVVADTTVVDFVGKDRVKTYIMTLMNIVNTVYHDDSLGVNIEVVTVKIMYMDEASERKVVRYNNPQQTVDSFCQWVSSQTYRSTRSGLGANHDVAVLLTRHKFATAGYAPITGMCLPMRNCALVRDDGFTSAFVIAHEMAHIFGLMHDGHGNTCYGRAYTSSIMATVVQSAFNHYWWSGCSKTQMSQVIWLLQCLNNNPYAVVKDDLRLPLGMSWTLDEQCRFEFGGNAKHCRIFNTVDPCSQMWCTDDTRRYSCKTKNVVPLDGTQCGRSPQWYCNDGACGYHGDHDPIDGEWSVWTSWSACAAQCGVGFKRRSRTCDSPAPEYDGNDCDGESENVDTCFTQECTEYTDQRSDQCSMMDIVPIRGTTHKWLPYQTNNDDDMCKLTCVADDSNNIVTFDSLVDNGTPCFYGESNFICLDGACEKVGCDGIRGSDVTLDRCGICVGDGSTCKVVSGTYSKKFDYSAAGGKNYDPVLVLPKGARNITVKETATLPHFLSLQDTFYYNYILNGDGKQGYSKNFVLEGSWFEYKNNRGHETLLSKGPLHRDVNVLTYPMDWQNPAEFHFSYTVRKDDFTLEKNKYKWKYEDWSPCSVSCGKGVQHLIYGCYDRSNDSKVEDELCQYVGTKDTDDVECEMMDCASLLYIWRMRRDYSQCSATCGDTGVYHQLFECERLSDRTSIDTEFCIHVPEPIIEEPCNRKDCAKGVYRWDVTTEWSECSATCGLSGSQYQLFHCVSEFDDGRIENAHERFCADFRSPKEPRPCNIKLCVEYRWEATGSWQGCNESCGDSGVQWKKLECMKNKDGVSINVGIWYCAGQEKPGDFQPCNRRTCFRYEWAITSDWNECSHTCGEEGYMETGVVCKNITYDDRENDVPIKYCNETEKPAKLEECNRYPCETYFWATSGNWSKCSEKCGDSGSQGQIFVCRSSSSGNVVEDYNCRKDEQNNTERPCNRRPCFTQEWRVQSNKWSPDCQKTCEDPVVMNQTQAVYCYQRFISGEEEKTDALFCNEGEMPLNTRPCAMLQCTVFRWNRTQNWSECEAPCGETGSQKSVLECVRYNGTSTERVGDEHCRNEAAPDDLARHCINPDCFSYIESDNTDWGPCSASCGEGVQVKKETCARTNNGVVQEVDSSNCQDAHIARSSQKCDAGPCGFLEWGAGPWSMCSRTCGPGQQKRVVYCGEPTQQSVFSRCPGKSPKEFMKCNNDPCVDGKLRTCLADRASFCDRASSRLCSHPAYNRVCCVSCQQYQQDEPSLSLYRRRRRHHIYIVDKNFGLLQVSDESILG